MLYIKNGHIIDPGSGIDEIRDIFIKDGKIAPSADCPDNLNGVRVIDAEGLIVAPGLVDMHVHLRDPGFTYKEDIITGAMAAAAGGVTTMACMPNTAPVIDSADTVKYVLDKAKIAPVNVLPYGAVTIGQQGMALTDMQSLKNAGAVALSDDGMPVESAALMRRALQAAKELDLLISSHCEYSDMVGNYAVNEGAISQKLQISGRPAIAEELMVARDAMLAAETGAKIHIAHVSTAGSVEIIRRAKSEGVKITAETCPQYFTLTEEEIIKQGAVARVNPPLRTEKDRRAIIAGLADGTIDAIATDHAPHSAEEKAMSLTAAPSGMVGLETSLALALTMLYHTEKFTINEIIKLMSTNPANILSISKGRIAEGNDGDIVIFDPNEKWTVNPENFKSKGKNTPFSGMGLIGRVKYTVVSGKVVYE